MQSLFFLMLLVLSLLIILLSVVGARSLRDRRRVTEARPRAGGSPTVVGDEHATRGRSAIWSSPIWNVIGVMAGIVGTIVSAVGLFR